MHCLKLLTLITTFIILSTQSSFAEKKEAPKKAEQAHEFLSYLVDREVLKVDTKLGCRVSRNTPTKLLYKMEECTSILESKYQCDNKKIEHTTNTKISWKYISEIELKQSGYNQDGKEIEIFGNVTVSHLNTKDQKNRNASEGNKVTISFDSAKTAQRALNAFSTLKKKCDTSQSYPF